MKLRPTNKQIQKAANRLRFYDWTELELTELIRRVRGIIPSHQYLQGLRGVAVNLEDAERVTKIIDQVEREVGEPKHIITLN